MVKLVYRNDIINIMELAVLKIIFLSISFAVGFMSHASAGFIDNKTQWDKLSQQQKNGYAMGAFDVMQRYWSNDSKKIIDAKARRGKCVVELQLTSRDLSNIIDSVYVDLNKWQTDAGSALIQGLYKVCKL